ncbi:hypothetical protein EBR56_08275 [bacterium]|nr:hypothetical protein [bacterium]
MVDGMQVRRNLVIRLGEGDDSLDLKNLRAFAAFFSGGGGTNSLVTDAATRARSRILSSGQFLAGAKP